ncbi:MAG: F0F1 ATP synthase subunit B [Coxiellaceae bacterium]|nr:F0F1 ATP synthase subunit B [Coxiellaceae bacterium]
MNINATLIGQVITFAIFIWFVMKFVWPPVVNMMEERRKKIADGLAAAEKGHRELELAHIKVQEQMAEAKAQAAKVIEQANQRASYIIEESKDKARDEGKRLLNLAQAEIEQERNMARETLLKEVSTLAVAGAEKILGQRVDQEQNARLVDEMIGEV